MIPSFRGAQAAIKKEAEQWGKTIQSTLADAISSSVPEGLREGSRKAVPESKKDGERVGKSFADSFKARVKAALATLPDAKIDADASPAERRIAELRADLQRLSDAKIGVDVDANAATARIDYIRGELDRLAAESPNVQVTVDAGRAAAELAAVQAEVDRLDGRHAEVNVDADASAALAEIAAVRGALGGLVAGGLALGATLIPVGAGVIGGLGGIAAAAVPAAAGLGGIAAVAVPAFGRISDATKAQQKAQEAQAKSAAQGARAAGGNAAQRVSAANRIQNAQLSLQQAQRSASRRSVQAAQRVADAQRNVARAREQSAVDQRSALDQVRQAEQSLENAQYSAASAQRGLNAAREEAVRNLRDMNLGTHAAAIAADQAQLNLKRAAAQLQQAQAQQGPRAPGQDSDAVKQARLDFERANLAVKRTTIEAKRAEEDYAKARRKGVSGADVVVNARHRLAQANQQVTNSERSLMKAHQNVAQVRAQSSQRIADAQRQVSRAEAAQAAQAQQSQVAITRAQRAVQAAQLAQASAAKQAAGGTSAAATAAGAYQRALAKLTPAERSTMRALQGLKDAFKSWGKALEPSVLPAFTKGLNLAKQLLPSLTPLVKSAADGFSTLLDSASKALQSPFWQKFFDFLGRTAGPTIVAFGRIIGNLAKGFFGLVMAFQPITKQVLGGLQHLTGAFAKFGANAGKNSGFQGFLAYIKRVGPLVVDTLGSIFKMFGHIFSALAPLGPILLHVVKGIADFISKIPKPVLLGIAVAIGVMAAAIGAVSLALSIATPVMAAFDVALAPAIGIIALITAAIAGLVIGIIYLVRNWKTVWHAIKHVALVVWGALKKAFSATWNFIKHTAITVWNAIKRFFVGAFHKFTGFFKGVWNGIKRFFARVWRGLKKDGIAIWNALKWFFTHAFHKFTGFFKGVWNGIKRFFARVWRGLKKDGIAIWNALKGFFVGAFHGFTRFFKGVWHGIVGKFKKIWGGVVKIAKDIWRKVTGAFRSGVNTVTGLINRIFIKPIDKVLHGIGLSKHVIPLIPRWHKAEGGYIAGPGGPMADRVPAMLSNGEYVVRARAVRQYGTGFMDSVNSGHYARGGPVNPPPGYKVVTPLPPANPAATVKKWLSKSASWMFEHVTDPIVHSIRSALPGGVIGDFGQGMINKTYGWAKQKITDLFHVVDGSNIKGGSGVKRWTPVVLRALDILGLPSSLLGTTLRRMNQESGGNPTIVNRTDSNWRKGTPSVGLMQVIGPTYRSYVPPRFDVGPYVYGSSVNPLADILASMRYALSRYGSLPAAYNRAGGYDSGGWLMPGASMAYNGTGKPEAVFTQGQLRQLAGRGGDQYVTTNVYPRQSTAEEVGVSVSRNTARRIRSLP